MRWAYVVFLLAYASIFAEVKLYEFRKIEFPKDFFNNDESIYGPVEPDDPSIDPQCAAFFDYKSLNSQEGLFFDHDDVLPLSVDTNVYFGADIEADTYNNETYIVNLMVLSTATASHYEMLNDLFSHYYECGYLNVSRETVEEFILKISLALDSSNVDNYLCEYNYDENNSLYYTTGEVIPDSHSIPPHGIYEIIDRLNHDDTIPDAVLKKNEFFHIDECRQYYGRPYTLMDLQGRILGRGSFVPHMSRPKQRSILLIQGVRAMYIK